MNWGVMVCPPGAVRVLPTKTHNKRQAPPPATRGLMTLGKRACGGVWWAALLLGKQKKSKKTPVLGCRALIKPKRKERGGGDVQNRQAAALLVVDKKSCFCCCAAKRRQICKWGGGEGARGGGNFQQRAVAPFFVFIVAVAPRIFSLRAVAPVHTKDIKNTQSRRTRTALSHTADKLASCWYNTEKLALLSCSRTNALSRSLARYPSGWWRGVVFPHKKVLKRGRRTSLVLAVQRAVAPSFLLHHSRSAAIKSYFVFLSL